MAGPEAVTAETVQGGVDRSGVGPRSQGPFPGGDRQADNATTRRTVANGKVDVFDAAPATRSRHAGGASPIHSCHPGHTGDVRGDPEPQRRNIFVHAEHRLAAPDERAHGHGRRQRRRVLPDGAFEQSIGAPRLNAPWGPRMGARAARVRDDHLAREAAGRGNASGAGRLTCRPAAHRAVALRQPAPRTPTTGTPEHDRWTLGPSAVRKRHSNKGPTTLLSHFTARAGWSGPSHGLFGTVEPLTPQTSPHMTLRNDLQVGAPTPAGRRAARFRAWLEARSSEPERAPHGWARAGLPRAGPARAPSTGAAQR